MQTSLTRLIHHHCNGRVFSVFLYAHPTKGRGFAGGLGWVWLVGFLKKKKNKRHTHTTGHFSFFLTYNFENLLLHESAKSLLTV